jgi:hypothetical protein
LKNELKIRLRKRIAKELNDQLEEKKKKKLKSDYVEEIEKEAKELAKEEMEKNLDHQIKIHMEQDEFQIKVLEVLKKVLKKLNWYIEPDSDDYEGINVEGSDMTELLKDAGFEEDLDEIDGIIDKGINIASLFGLKALDKLVGQLYRKVTDFIFDKLFDAVYYTSRWLYFGYTTCSNFFAKLGVDIGEVVEENLEKYLGEEVDVVRGIDNTSVGPPKKEMIDLTKSDKGRLTKFYTTKPKGLVILKKPKEVKSEEYDILGSISDGLDSIGDAVSDAASSFWNYFSDDDEDDE